METPASVLLIEPSPLMLLLERTLLARRGWEIRTAGSVAEARTQLTRAVPSIVISSDRLPDGEAEEVCRTVRQLEAGQDVPLLFVVGANSDRTVASLREAGASEILFKPLIAHEVDQMINRLLGLAVRRWKRHDFNTLVSVSNGDGLTHLAVARNLSVDGMMLELAEAELPIAEGDRVQIRFFVPDAAKEITGTAEVVWTRRIEATPHLGIRFYRLGPGATQRLTRYCGFSPDRN